MTTVVDPSGTPVPIYNQSGTTIVDVTAGSINPNPSQTPIPRDAGTTIALVTSSATNSATGVGLLSGADIGDLVEIHAVAGVGVTVFSPSGETLHGASNGSLSFTNSSSRVFRKISATDWRLIGAA